MDCYRGNFVFIGTITYLKCLKETHFSERPIPDTTNPNRTDPSIGSDRFGKFYRYRPIMSILAHIYRYVLLIGSIGRIGKYRYRFGSVLFPSSIGIGSVKARVIFIMANTS